MTIIEKLNKLEARYMRSIDALQARIEQLEKPTPLQEWAKKTAEESDRQQVKVTEAELQKEFDEIFHL